MNFVAIASLTSLLFSTVAYWRSGGKTDVQRARRELDREVDMLRQKYEELIQSAEQSLTSAYDSSRRRLAAARQRLRELKDRAVQGLETQLATAQQHLEALSQRLEEAAKAARAPPWRRRKKLSTPSSRAVTTSK